MILNTISAIVIIISFISAYRAFKKNKSLISSTYLERPMDYIWSLLTCICAMFLVGFCVKLNLPKFLTWSWFNLISETSTGGNIMFSGFQVYSVFFILVFWILLCLSMPYFSRSEEEIFRSGVLELKPRIVSNLTFGLVHMIMGVPLFCALILSVVGFVFSIFYVKEFKRQCLLGSDYEEADKNAIFASTSIHTKYNFILVTLAALMSILVVLE